ncbi:MAG: hypothetical protein J6S96_08600 [Muribaculaceae bacterium]|nr:hypothetical protein [Muribaculaceae bacterium]
MKPLSILSLLVVMLTACGATTQNGNSSTNDEFKFLKELGIDVNSIVKLDKEVILDYDKYPPFIMSDAQQKVLLEEVGDLYRMDEDIEGNFSILGIRALPNGQTLILYNVEFGDGASKVFAIYDKDGKTTDYMDTGYWNDTHPDESNDDYTHGTAYGDETTCSFDSPSTMKLARKYKFFEWTNNKETYEQKVVKEFWSIDKQYDYSITNEGIFQLDNITSKNVGPVDAKIATLEEISDLNFVPSTDRSLFDRVNQLALRDDIRKEIPNENCQISYRMMGVVQDLFHSQPQRLLQWISTHRDLNKNALTGVFEACFSTGLLPKEDLIEEIDKMPQGDARRYIEELTAQWGPADAVG